MDVEKLQEIIGWMQRSPLQELALEDGDFRIRLVRGVQGSVQPVPAPTMPVAGAAIAAPSYGIVHLSPTPGAPSFVTPGARVEIGQTLCVLEAMKVFSPVAAERAGTIAEILVADGSEVSAGQILFRLD